MRKQRSLHLIISAILLCLGSLSVYADNLSLQRWQFEQALDALKVKDLERFHALSVDLQNYPLYYYLRYQYLQPRLKKVAPVEIKAFLTQYGDSYFGASLRSKWLKQLAKAEDWTTFILFYTPQKSTRLQCDYVQARLMTRRDTSKALQDAKKLWLSPKSQPKSCNPVFQYLYQTGLINNTLLWERIGLAMKKGRLSLAQSLAKHLDPADRVLVARWKTMHKNPAKTLEQFDEPDLPVVREIILHGIKRLAKKRFEKATEYWDNFQRYYAFSILQIGEMQRDLALASVKKKHPNALTWLTAVNKNFLNEKVTNTRFKLALKQQNWPAIVDFMTELSEKEQDRLQWRYWLARALEQTGQSAKARPIFRALANERDYYGFLAADHIGSKHKMQHHPIRYTSAEKAKLMKHVGITGAHEFYNLSQLHGSHSKWVTNGRREWHYITTHLPRHQKAIAATFASSWGWHDRAIIAAAKAGHYDDLDVRFPLVFYKALAAGANSQALDLAWVYAIVRQESAFMSDARSRVGALGLMQLMPATGRLVAKKIGLKLNRTRDILDINTNISLGTGYLRQMLDKFDGNYMLATASYNAGPVRAKRWAAKNNCMPADIWVELIPFNETRKYVRSVLFYISIFESRLGKQTHPLRLTLVQHDNC